MSRPASVVFACLLSATCVAACSDDPTLETPDKEVCLARADGQRYCIETYEASKRDATGTSAGDDTSSKPRSLPGRMPWVEVTWQAAKDACASKNKRLCERDEWIDACDGTPGTGGTKYAYGDELDASRCNTGGTGPEASGTHATCRASTGTYDQSGNVWEWTGNIAAVAAARGGGFRSSTVHECKSGDGTLLYPPGTPSSEVGFRCCRDQ